TPPTVRSCTVVGSSLVSSITSRSPTGTVTVSGTNRMSWALTCTVVVSPVAATPAEPAPPSEVVPIPAAAGSTATPTLTASSTATRAPISCPRRQNTASCCVARGGGSDVPGSPALRRAASATPTSGRNQARPTSTSTEETTSTQLGTGSRQSTRAALAITIRSAP